jgi:hypothetical protein
VSAIYINTIKQISAQQPLSDAWFEAPVPYRGHFVHAIDPDFKHYLASGAARRLGKLLKRALVVSQQAMQASGIAMPDAIITGTGMGCIENTEHFLEHMVQHGEECLSPTQFMQSTHNTISSMIAIAAKCHNYNMTYAHKGISCECALQDAFLQMQAGKIQNALVGAHDEMTHRFISNEYRVSSNEYRVLSNEYRVLSNEYKVSSNEYKVSSNEYKGINESDLILDTNNLILDTNNLILDTNNLILNSFAGETSAAMILSKRRTQETLCRIDNVEKYYGKTLAANCLILDTIIDSPPDYVMVGTNGMTANDSVYFENCARLFPHSALLHYKHVFGESFTAPALGIYAAALCLGRQHVPEFLIAGGSMPKNIPPKSILCYNHVENKNHTFISLSSI